MLFNSWEFLLFLPLVLGGYYYLPKKSQNLFLLGASYFFYGWWDYRFCGLLAISTVVDYFVGSAMGRVKEDRVRKKLLLVSLASNLGILGFFKYFNFFVGSAEVFLEKFGMQSNIMVLQILLPVGISFYTFQTLSYTIDVYRKKLEPVHNPVDFALYVAFFPQLVAGPIERATHLMPQIQGQRKVNWEKFSTGFQLIFIGFVRKLLIADVVAVPVNEIFGAPEQQSSMTLLIGLYLFSIQIYCDFAGYTDIARGCSRLMGIDLMRNFEHPYFSTSITEFWRRWHISLSTWLRDYLYIPLGGNRKGTAKTYRNLMLTMLLGGLWHGANWTFVIWGALHGSYLAVHKFLLGEKRAVTENRPRTLHEWPRELFWMIITFHLVALTWIFFRAEGIQQAWGYLTGIFSFEGGINLHGVSHLGLAVLLLALIDIPQYQSGRHTVFLRWPWPIRALLYVGLFIILCAFRSDGDIPFIYFQF